jgi:hypothetical protein
MPRSTLTGWARPCAPPGSGSEAAPDAGRVRHAPGAPLLPLRDVIVLASWAVAGLLGAVVLFRWEPHRPTRRRAAQAKADAVARSSVRS